MSYIKIKSSRNWLSYMWSRMRINYLHRTCTLNIFSQRGEQCPVEKTPTRVTPHLSAHECHEYTIKHISVKCLHECPYVMHEMSSCPYPESSPTPSHMHMPSVKTIIGSTNDPFSKTKSFFFYHKIPLDKPPMYI